MHRTMASRRTILAGLVSAIAVVLAGGAGAGAISPINHEEPIITGDVGVHILIDSGEPYAGVTCRYQGGQLIGFRIRRPIALQDGIYRVLFASWLTPVNASLAFAITFVMFWFAILYVLYRKQIFFRV